MFGIGRPELGSAGLNLLSRNPAAQPIYALETVAPLLGAPATRMDYYEEFGVDRSAAVAEIRQAYKRLVKLLHPDHCRDEAVRRLADLQMKRLNGILKTLTDPLERAGYDLILARPPQPPQLPDRRLARPPLPG